MGLRGHSDKTEGEIKFWRNEKSLGLAAVKILYGKYIISKTPVRSKLEQGYSEALWFGL